MDVIEKAIRNAFEKGNPEDRTFRVKVYRSAFAALERAIASSPETTPDAVEARRKALKIKIVEIEAEFLPAAETGPARQTSAPVDAPAVEPDRRDPSDGQRMAPPIDVIKLGGESALGHERGPEPRIEPDDYKSSGGYPDFDAPGEDGRPAYVVRRDPGRRRRLLPILVSLVILVAVIGAGYWWVDGSGLFPTGGDQAGDNPPTTIAEENAQPSGDSGSQANGATQAAENWINIFSPADPTTVTAPAKGQAQALEEDGGKFLRIQSGAAGSEFAFDIGQGVLEQIAGKHAVFDIAAHAEEGKETQMSVSCNFGALGDCGRKRYHVGHERNDFLFEMDMPAKAPGGGGKITIDPDIDGQGKPVDIVEIRVSTTP